MMETKTIRELCDIVVDCPHSTPKWTTSGKIVIRNNNIKKGSIDFSSPSYTDDEHFNLRVKRAIPRSGDIIITREAPMGEVGMIPERIECCLGQRMVLLRTNPDICDNYYLLYSLQSKFVQHQISWSEGTGTTVSNLRIPHLEQLKIPYVPLKKQRLVASVLKSIEEKIILNEQINNNLEQQIEMVLLKTINDTDTQPVKLGDYLYIKGRIGWKGLKKSEYLPISNYRIINGESLTLSGIDWKKAGYISAERYEESPEIMLSIGDILLSKDGTIGKIGYVDKLDAPTSVASGIFVIRNTRQSEISTQFIYYLLKSKLFKTFIASRTEGSVIPHLYQKDFMEFEFQLPSPDDMKIFDDTTADMFSLVFSNLNENERLIHLRDSLLPKLMSGELDVSDTDI